MVRVQQLSLYFNSQIQFWSKLHFTFTNFTFTFTFTIFDWHYIYYASYFAFVTVHQQIFIKINFLQLIFYARYEYPTWLIGSLIATYFYVKITPVLTQTINFAVTCFNNRKFFNYFQHSPRVVFLSSYYKF